MDESNKRLNLLMFTQRVDLNDSVQGFAHRWIEEFAKNVLFLHVITGYLGEHSLPENVLIHSLGKEKGTSKYKRILKIYKISLPLLLNKKVDAIFAHQIQHFIIAIGLIAKIIKIPMFLFYAHKAVPLSLKMVVPLCKKIFTSTNEGFRINVDKKVIVGQGIDTTQFKYSSYNSKEKKNILLCVGRISPIKDQETVIKAGGKLRDKAFENFKIVIVGNTMTDKDETYKTKLNSLVNELNLVNFVDFVGSTPNRMMENYYSMSNLVINPSLTGSLDKVVLECMSCGRIPLVANESLRKEFGEFSQMLIFKEKDYNDLADKIERLWSLNIDQLNYMGRVLRNKVIEDHNLFRLMLKITKEIEEAIVKV
jgi:glycosyltransferase involved in cell wall biosynthesis